MAFELEDVPESSRRFGPEGALDAFDRKLTLSMRYLREAVLEIGLDIA